VESGGRNIFSGSADPGTAVDEQEDWRGRGGCLRCGELDVCFKGSGGECFVG
jgi:hypothetical protein